MHRMHAAARDGDTVTVRTLLSTADALSLINTQDASGATPLHFAALVGHASVTKQLIEARCNMNLQTKDGATPLDTCFPIDTDHQSHLPRNHEPSHRSSVLKVHAGLAQFCSVDNN
jgi:ankyrin repeat protein